MNLTNIRIVHYNRHSAGATSLAKELGIKKANVETTFLGQKHTLINWGFISLPDNIRSAGRIINNPDLVRGVSNKVTFFERMDAAGMFAPRTPDHTTDTDTAMSWLSAGYEVLGRSVVNGKGGEGIIFGSDEDKLEDFLECPLYVKYKKKKDEYRVHILFEQITDVQQKLLRVQDDNGTEIKPDRVDYRVRNLANGFIFARNNVNPPADVLEQARLAYKASGLDFGAIDIIYNRQEDKAYVLEINSAPGLMGTTVEQYANRFRQVLELKG